MNSKHESKASIFAAQTLQLPQHYLSKMMQTMSPLNCYIMAQALIFWCNANSNAQCLHFRERLPTLCFGPDSSVWLTEADPGASSLCIIWTVVTGYTLSWSGTSVDKGFFDRSSILLLLCWVTVGYWRLNFTVPSQFTAHGLCRCMVLLMLRKLLSTFVICPKCWDYTFVRDLEGRFCLSGLVFLDVLYNLSKLWIQTKLSPEILFETRAWHERFCSLWLVFFFFFLKVIGQLEILHTIGSCL